MSKKNSKNGQKWPYLHSRFCVKCALTVFNIFKLNFQNQRRTKLRTYNLLLGFFSFFRKKFSSQFRNSPGNSRIWKPCWFHSKISIFGQKWHAWATIFWANWAEIFYGSSGDHYLSTCDEKSKFRCLFFIFKPILAGRWAWPPRAPLMVLGLQSKPNQKVGPLDGPFGPPAISFEIFRGDPPTLKIEIYYFDNNYKSKRTYIISVA